MLLRLVDFLETYFDKNSPLFLGVRPRGPVVSILTLTNYSYLPWVRGLVVNILSLGGGSISTVESLPLPQVWSYGACKHPSFYYCHNIYQADQQCQTHGNY